MATTPEPQSPQKQPAKSENAEATTVELLTAKLKAATDKITALEGRNEVWILASQIPLEPQGDQKPVITHHPELGYYDAEHLADKGRKNRSTLFPFKLKKAE